MHVYALHERIQNMSCMLQHECGENILVRNIPGRLSSLCMSRRTILQWVFLAGKSEKLRIRRVDFTISLQFIVPVSYHAW